MISAYDTESGLFYVALTSKETPVPDEPKHHSTLGEGLVIFGGFLLCGLAIIIAI